MLRTPSAIEGQGGASSAVAKKAKGNMLMLRDQVADLAVENGLQSSVASLLPTPMVSDRFNDGLKSTQHVEGSMHSVSLAQIVHRDDLLPTVVVSDASGARNNTSGRAEGSSHHSGSTLADVLLPTPKAQDGYKGNLKTSQERLDAGYFVDLPNVAVDLMPTPTTRDHKDGQAEHERDGVVQTDTLSRQIFSGGEVLLPTPTTQDSSGRCRDHGGDLLHDIQCGCSRSDRKASKVSQAPKEMATPGVDGGTQWGKFEPAIRRWELITGRPVPAPTKADGRDNAHRLSSRFTEWMMGLPEGWITDVGISRNDELKACGNGVVPQQAVLALQMILSRKSESKND